MDFLDNNSLELLKGIFTDSVRTDILRVSVAAVFWKEISGIRKGLDGLITRVDDHERRLDTVENKNATCPTP